ncbi:uncharacterized protein [Canis lupus baileyi]|uniref:uncharacterized protein n=1 Tax=Canis lupus baileyi TaxID=143281 RepID=UPI003B9702CA
MCVHLSDTSVSMAKINGKSCNFLFPSLSRSEQREQPKTLRRQQSSRTLFYFEVQPNALFMRMGNPIEDIWSDSLVWPLTLKMKAEGCFYFNFGFWSSFFPVYRNFHHDAACHPAWEQMGMVHL